MRVAVADVGTNSSHLLIAEARARSDGDPGGFVVLEALKDRTRLGDCLDGAGHLTPEGEDRLASALTRFGALAAAAGVAEVHVAATSALREAPNGREVAARMAARTGIYPAIISGEREGELTYLGVAHSVELADDNVLLDLGGGSLEFVRGDRHAAREVLSLPLGSIRMTRAFLGAAGAGTVGRRELDALQTHVRLTLQAHAARFAVRDGTRVLLSSGTAEAAAQCIAAQRSSGPGPAGLRQPGPGGESEPGAVNGVSFTLEKLGALLEQVRRLKAAQRAKLPGLERRADTIVAGLAVLHAALSTLGAQTVTVSEGALREGLLIEELTRLEAYTSGLSPRQRSVLATAERFGANLSHSRQVAALARGLLERLTASGEAFPDEARSLLTAAGALHEVGLIVAQSSHHKHGAYLIRHAGLLGFAPRDIELIAQLARYHRKSPPKAAHTDYAALSPQDQRLVSRLAAILRVADGLDRSHAGTTRLGELRRQGGGWALQLEGATPLDLEGARLKADLWTQEFGPLNLSRAEG